MTTQTEAQHYPNRDAEALGQDYINHISAMTTEGLRSKSSIAIQLAWRDVEIRRLEAANAELLAALKMNAQALSWLAFGECRGFTDNLPTALEATGAARAAIAKHGGQS